MQGAAKGAVGGRFRVEAAQPRGQHKARGGGHEAAGGQPGNREAGRCEYARHVLSQPMEGWVRFVSAWAPECQLADGVPNQCYGVMYMCALEAKALAKSGFDEDGDAGGGVDKQYI